MVEFLFVALKMSTALMLFQPLAHYIFRYDGFLGQFHFREFILFFLWAILMYIPPISKARKRRMLVVM